MPKVQELEISSLTKQSRPLVSLWMMTSLANVASRSEFNHIFHKIENSINSLENEMAYEITFQTVHDCGSWNKNARSSVLYIWKLGHQGVAYLRKIRRCNLAGGSVVTGGVICGFKSPGQFQSLSLLAACGSECRTFSYFSSTTSAYVPLCPHHDETVLSPWDCKQAPMKCFLFSELLWSWYLFPA